MNLILPVCVYMNMANVYVHMHVCVQYSVSAVHLLNVVIVLDFMGYLWKKLVNLFLL